jgi:probable rRNA maturation factor
VFAKGLKRLSVEADKLTDASTLQRFDASTITIRNRQRVRRVNARLLQEITEAMLTKLPGVHSHELCLHLVAAPEMARLNEQFLGHKGATDVITFDHSDRPSRSTRHVSRCTFHVARTPRPAPHLHGEIFICLKAAVVQARQFRTTWQSELVRYVIHGLLHLIGYDDLRPPARVKMKREENRLLRQICGRFVLLKLAKPSVRRVNRNS